MNFQLHSLHDDLSLHSRRMRDAVIIERSGGIESITECGIMIHVTAVEHPARISRYAAGGGVNHIVFIGPGDGRPRGDRQRSRIERRVLHPDFVGPG